MEPTPAIKVPPVVSIVENAAKLWQNRDHFDVATVDRIYESELNNAGSKKALEFSQFLENYLWPNFDANTSTKGHLISIVVMVNEKFRERIPAWRAFLESPENFPGFFRRVMQAALDEKSEFTNREHTSLLIFLIHCFNSVEVELIRKEIVKVVSLRMWSEILSGRRDTELQNNPTLKRYWAYLAGQEKKMSEEDRHQIQTDRRFFKNLMHRFYKLLDSIPSKDEAPELDASTVEVVTYCERFIELMVDLEALLPTRRYFNVVLDNSHLIVRCSLSNLAGRPEGRLFLQLLDMLKFYAKFEIDDATGEALRDTDMTALHYDKIGQLQTAAFKYFPELNRFPLRNVANVDRRESLLEHIGNLSANELHRIAAFLQLAEPLEEGKDSPLSKEFLIEVLIARNERRQSQLETLNEMPLYPTEKVIWDENIVPSAYFNGEGCLALPKLNLQFLTLHDYLLRNFQLFRLESTYEIRQNIEDAILRMKPWAAEDGGVIFGGWSRMATPVTNFNILEVGEPRLGEKQPSVVRADITVHLNVKRDVKFEWESLRKHDVMFLVTVRPTRPPEAPFDHKEPFIPQVGLTYVRGCEIEGLLDPTGKVIEDFEQVPQYDTDDRTFRVLLDCNQYREDMEKLSAGGDDVNQSYNILLRRKPKENNFKAVLETIRELMNTDFVVPDWLQDIILGYGDPGSAHYTKMSSPVRTMSWNDTFLDIDHLKQSFSDYEIEVYNPEGLAVERPFRLEFCDIKAKQKPAGEKKLLVTPYKVETRSPYLAKQPKANVVPFTATQIEAIKSGMQPGLTMVVGPPGTGKTDVAVQIISNIYHNFPEQRTLIVTHSNQALNQLFEKIMALDIDERHLLRLGHGEEQLETEKDFSRYGRVNYVLARRLYLLSQVGLLQQSLDVTGDVAYTCETAAYFYLHHVLARWEAFLDKLRDSTEDPAMIEKHFPFTKFFHELDPLFSGKSYDSDMDVATKCFHYIQDIFGQLEEFRSFEMMRSGLDRSRYLLVKEAKIIAMTCTHAALKRHELVRLGFKYDNILMEESAQILEIETFIPLLLQNPQDGYNRLKRWIMIGDHHQLPPVIKNMAFQKYSNMEQSLFTRFVRLGVPVIQLDGQGRSRPSLCSLYNWRYVNLGNLPHVLERPEYQTANAGLAFDFQLINVEDFNGVGESEPNPYFYQNLAEAEYCAALFMYMRILGYPAERISILTTYNGQKHLLRDVIEQRCGNNPLIGKPHKITTVDKYQGQQNDYILLSLVRTKNIGHIRDVRRLVVALSRARLGLYIFGRVSLLRSCFELQKSFDILLKRPQKLCIVQHEQFPTKRLAAEEVTSYTVEDMPAMAQIVFDLYAKNAGEMHKEHVKGMAKTFETIRMQI
ncbi:intron-binding protein aquarius-like [Tropilaelaps mercedesae]|uniref:RNA helicase aquarius n=1 Tax=Tropilaelaps mercedesae TaxID=418985 RepID=A0A1V9XFZ5_9ACAR|nr:intron-binding protein aquarius-like [Tropilaelaps mercedesae]